MRRIQPLPMMAAFGRGANAWRVRMYLRQSTGFETHVSQPELALPHAQTHRLDGLAAAVFDLLVLASGMFAIGTEASSSPACCPGAAAAIAGARPVP